MRFSKQSAMSEFKFSCPTCGQHLAVDSGQSGQSINCPACQQLIAAPPAPKSAVPPVLSGSHRVVPPPPNLVFCTSKLAIASLICSIASFILPFSFIPGIVCGHVAKGRMRRDPALGGRGLATAGLIVGYIGLALTLVVATLIVLAVAAPVSLRTRQAAAQAAREAATHQPSVGIEAAPSESAALADRTPDGSGWTLDLANAAFPPEPVSGRIHGQSFTMEKVALNGGFLEFRQGQEFFADLEMDVVLFEGDLAKLSGRSFRMPIKEVGVTPHIYVKWLENGGRSPQTKSYTEGYALRLEFGQYANGKLPGKIYLCAPDAEKSFIRGSFEVNGRGDASP